MKNRNSHFPLDDQGRLPHLMVPPAVLPETVLLVGDPERMDLLPTIWDNVEWIANRREFRVARGMFGGTPIGCCATGIGGPAMEIAVVELAHAGVRALLRAGGCGALTEDLALGELVAPTAMVRQGGASNSYAPPEYPAAADWQWLAALQSAADQMGETLKFDLGISTASYYAGQARPLRPTDRPLQEAWPEFWARRGVHFIDMESDTLFTVGRLLGLRCASLLAVHAHRATGKWLEDYRSREAAVMQLASKATIQMSTMLH